MQKNFELLFTALALLTIELANEDVVIDLIRLSLALQVHTHTRTRTRYTQYLGVLRMISCLYWVICFITAFVTGYRIWL